MTLNLKSFVNSKKIAMFAFISIFFFTTLCGASLKSSFDLKGKWLVWNSNHSLVMYSNVPGNVHTALLQNGLIGNPYYRFNDADHRWIGLDNWTFSRSFEGLYFSIYKTAQMRDLTSH